MCPHVQIDKVSYQKRMIACTFLMVASFLIVGYGQSLGVQLLGVACCSMQSGLGEASVLGLTSKYHTASTLTAWSSGTGFAGLLGYGWVVLFTQGLEFSLSSKSAAPPHQAAPPSCAKWTKPHRAAPGRTTCHASAWTKARLAGPHTCFYLHPVLYYPHACLC